MTDTTGGLPPDLVDRCARAVKGTEKILLGKAPRWARRSMGLSEVEVRKIARLFAEAFDPASTLVTHLAQPGRLGYSLCGQRCECASTTDALAGECGRPAEADCSRCVDLAAPAGAR